MTVDADPSAPHPLDLLTEDEVRAATTALRADDRIPSTALCAFVALYEPPKDEVLAFRPGDTVDRRVRYVLYDKPTRTAYQVVVSATQSRVSSVESRPGLQPTYLLVEDLLFAAEAVRTDERFVAACRARGIDDMASVQLDPWPAGRFGEPWETTDDGTTRRICRVIGYHRHTPVDNGYAHPLDGVVATVDLDAMTVIEVTDDGTTTVPAACHNYGVDAVGPARTTTRPIEVTQPEGPSFTLAAGNHVSWEKWRLRFTMHPVEGLVLHQVTYDGRSVLHRAGLAEMVVPYAGSGANTWWKNTFDAGELSMGRLANSLTLGCDCLGDITYVDGVFADDHGNPFTLPRVVCLHEEDAGVLWKHTDLFTGTVEVRRARRLVVNAVFTAGNYEYVFSWQLWNDGRIALEMRLSGIVQTEAALPDGSPPPQTRLIAPGLASSHHQHLFCVRLDLDVDGRENCVVETDVAPVPSEHGNAWEPVETRLASERDGARDASPTTGRRWRVENRSVRNGVGQPVAYELVPQVMGPVMLADASSSVARRAAFGRHAVWVTAYDDAQTRAAGEFPNLSEGGDGLPEYVAQDRPLVDSDVVLWHTIGSTHVVRPEDWPVMPVEMCGFVLRPVGFFDRNPALDVPAGDHCAS